MARGEPRAFGFDRAVSTAAPGAGSEGKMRQRGWEDFE